MYCITKFLIILVLVLRFCLYTLYRYLLIACYELISLYKPDVLFMYCIYKIIIIICIYCQDPFCTVAIFILMTSSVSNSVDLCNTE